MSNPIPDDQCPYCGGTGTYEFIDPKCPRCGGKGMFEELRSHESPSVGSATPGYSEWVPCSCRRRVECKHFRKDKPERYAPRSDIVRQALATLTHSLDELLSLMRRLGLAALYFFGTRLDHECCFGGDDVGMLLSVLPQDAHAAEPGYHPGSTEVYITFQGRLVIECLENGQVRDKTVGGNEVLVIPPGQCHRVRHDKREAASVIVKTKLSAKPSVIRCTECTYYVDPKSCPLHLRWNEEKKAE